MQKENRQLAGWSAVFRGLPVLCLDPAASTPCDMAGPGDGDNH